MSSMSSSSSSKFVSSLLRRGVDGKSSQNHSNEINAQISDTTNGIENDPASAPAPVPVPAPATIPPLELIYVPLSSTSVSLSHSGRLEADPTDSATGIFQWSRHSDDGSVERVCDVAHNVYYLSVDDVGHRLVCRHSGGRESAASEPIVRDTDIEQECDQLFSSGQCSFTVFDQQAPSDAVSLLFKRSTIRVRAGARSSNFRVSQQTKLSIDHADERKFTIEDIESHRVFRGFASSGRDRQLIGQLVAALIERASDREQDNRSKIQTNANATEHIKEADAQVVSCSVPLSVPVLSPPAPAAPAAAVAATPAAPTPTPIPVPAPAPPSLPVSSSVDPSVSSRSAGDKVSNFFGSLLAKSKADKDKAKEKDKDKDKDNESSSARGSLTRPVASADSSVADSSSASVASSARVSEVEADSAEHKQQMQELRDQLALAHSQLSACTSTIAQLRKEGDVYKKELGRNKEALNRLDALEIENHRLMREMEKIKEERQRELDTPPPVPVSAPVPVVSPVSPSPSFLALRLELDEALARCGQLSQINQQQEAALVVQQDELAALRTVESAMRAAQTENARLLQDRGGLASALRAVEEAAAVSQNYWKKKCESLQALIKERPQQAPANDSSSSALSVAESEVARLSKESDGLRRALEFYKKAFDEQLGKLKYERETSKYLQAAGPIPSSELSLLKGLANTLTEQLTNKDLAIRHLKKTNAILATKLDKIEGKQDRKYDVDTELAMPPRTNQ